MAQYVGVAFKRLGQIYYFLASPFVLALNDMVLVKTEEGIGFGQIVALRDTIPPGLDPEAIKPIYRPANEEDIEIGQENQKLAQEAMVFCQQCVDRLVLEMKLVEVEIYFDKSKMIFYFTAPGRVDFRELVKELVRAYRTRIELRQIGVRHETQMIGALGNCGQVCCCRRYLRRFETVTIKMAKDQNLFLNPAKISGACGRLLCCLAYEKDSYADFQNRAPKVGRRYLTTLGFMRTLRTNMFREAITAVDEAGQEHEFSLTQWTELLLPDQPRGPKPSPGPEEIPHELKILQDPEVENQDKKSTAKNFGTRQPKGHGRPVPKHTQRPKTKSETGQQEQKAPATSPKRGENKKSTAPLSAARRDKRRRPTQARKNRTSQNFVTQK